MKSKILSASLIWENMKKQIWLFALIFLAFAFVYPLELFHSFDQWKHYMDLTSAEIMERLLLYIQYSQGNSGLAILTGAALANGIFGFSWLHSRQKTDFYHSLPLRRESLFCNQTVIGILFYLVPEIAAALLGLCICASQGYFTLEIAGTMAGMVALHLLVYLLIYLLVVLAMLLTGNLLVGILGAAGFLVYFPGITYLLEGYKETFFVTHVGSMDGGLSILNMPLVRYGSPLGWYEKIMRDLNAGEAASAAEIIGAVIVCVVLYLLSIWIYKKRSSESTGKAMVFTGFGKVVKFLVEIPASLLVGLLAYQMAPVGGGGLVWFICGLVIGLVLSHSVMEIIYQQDFRKFFRHRLELGIEAVLTAGIVLVFALDITGYDSYLPSQDELAYVSLNQNSLTSENQVILSRDEKNDTLNIQYLYDLPDGGMELQPDEQIYDLLQQFQANREKFQWKEQQIDEEQDIQYIEVMYKLKNGKSVYRNYRVAMDQELQEDMNALWNRVDFRDGMYLDWENKKDYLLSVQWESVDDLQEMSSVGEQGGQEFMDALKKDIENADMNTYMEYPVGKIYFNYGDTKGESKNPPVAATDVYLIYPGFSNVLALLEEKDARVVTSLADENIESVAVHKYGRDSEGLYEESRTEYTSKEDIENLLPYLVYNNYWSFQLPEKDTDYDVEVTRRNSEGTVITSYFTFEKGNVPEEFQ